MVWSGCIPAFGSWILRGERGWSGDSRAWVRRGVGCMIPAVEDWIQRNTRDVIFISNFVNAIFSMQISPVGSNSPLQYTPYAYWHTPHKAKCHNPHSHTATHPRLYYRNRRSSDSPERATQSATAWAGSRRTRQDGDWRHCRRCS